jgi:hypothetical protein
MRLPVTLPVITESSSQTFFFASAASLVNISTLISESHQPVRGTINHNLKINI